MICTALCYDANSIPKQEGQHDEYLRWQFAIQYD